MNLIEINNLSKTYTMGKVEVTALDNISLVIEEGDFVSIMGHSGSGKSTLLHILGLLDKHTHGNYNLLLREVSKLSDDELAALRNRYLGFIFQSFNLLPRTTSKENVALPKIYSNNTIAGPDEIELLKKVGLEGRIYHKPNELSGGQQQRVAIARALINNPLIIFADEPTGNLDSKAAAEIIDILEKLNDSGITVVMVTHEPDLAQVARRIITLQDGKIISDEKKTPLVNHANLIEKSQVLTNSYKHKIFGTKIIKEYFAQALRSLTSNKTRSILSILGVLIGVSSLIAMMALGTGAQEDVKKRMSSLGSNLLMVSPARHTRTGVHIEDGASIQLTIRDSEEIRKIPGVDKTAPYVNGNAQLVYGNKNWNTRIIGTTQDYTSVKNAVPATGRFFTEEETISRTKVAVIGNTVLKELFNNKNPIGEFIKINRIDFQVIGILPEKGSTGFQNQDDVVVIPLNTAMYRLLGKEYINSIDIHVADMTQMDRVGARIKKLIVMLHRLPVSKEEETIEIRNMAEIQETITATVKTFSMLLGSIAFISLLVGGIGIMNIMLVSVTERTREIGLRKAIGARNKDILFQFVIEAVIICILGGIIGILFGAAISLSLAKFAGWSTTVSVSSVLLAFTFSFFVGLIFGLWPAKKASQLSPIEALRYE